MTNWEHEQIAAEIRFKREMADWMEKHGAATGTQAQKWRREADEMERELLKKMRGQLE